MGMNGGNGSGSGSGSSTNWGGIATAGAGLAGGVLGMIGQGKRAKKAHNRNKELMGMQFANQQALNKQGQELQMKTWRDTGYSAQMQMMKAAGLNPALMYGMRGGGGQTTGSQGGGSASGNSSHAPMDIGAVVQASLAGAQKGLLDSQKALNESQAKKNEVEANKISGVDTDLGEAEINKINKMIEEMESKVKLNASNVLKNKSEVQKNDSVIKLNKSIGELNSQKTLESIASTKITNKDLEWMQLNGLNKNDSVVAKTIKYLSNKSELSEKAVIGIMGGAFALKELVKLIPTKVLADILGKGATVVKGF